MPDIPDPAASALDGPDLTAELDAADDTRKPTEPGPCQCMTSFAAVSPTHPGHCCFIPASQECHAAEVAEWERQRDRRWAR